MSEKFLSFYSRVDVQEKIVEAAEDREIAPRYGKGFGRRPDVVQFAGDVLEMAKNGATSFHISEERWHEPLHLKPGMSKSVLDENRKGWDFILDIDTKCWQVSKWCTFYLIEALKFHDVHRIGVKFSGNKGFHISVPFESFPDAVNGVDAKKLFPESLRVMAAYLQNMIYDMLSAKMLEEKDAPEWAKEVNKKTEDVMQNGKFNPFEIVDIDTVLISNRHLYRSPYSMHEKSELVSVPIDIEHVLKFDKSEGEINNVKTDKNFLQLHDGSEKDAKTLIIQAFDWWGKKNRVIGAGDLVEGPKKRELYLPTEAILENCFPNCITSLLAAKLEDGKKRALFVLLNFLKHMNWRTEDIEERIKQWNKQHPQGLSESYLIGQLNWQKKQKDKIMPPNCTKDSFYKDMSVKCPDKICNRCKNPVNAALSKHRWLNKIKKDEDMKKAKRKKKTQKRDQSTKTVSKDQEIG
jgi:hypothetical protein